MFVRIASATERIFSASTQRSRRPAAGSSALCLALIAALALPAQALTRQEMLAIRAQRAATAHNQARPVAAAAPAEKDAATPSGAGHVEFGSVKAGETSAEKEAAFTFNRTVTLGKIEVLTMGAPDLDFKDAHSGTCEANRTYKAGDSCTVRVNVTPKFAGLRKGAVVLSDNLGERVGTLFVAAAASKPVLLFPGSGTVTDLSVDGSNVSGTFWNDPEGLAIDGSGNIFVVDAETNSLYKLTAGSYARTTIDTDNGSGSLDGPWGVAVDGSGNVYVAASGLTDSADPTVWKYAAGSYSKSSVASPGGGWTSPNQVTVDGSGNLYVADYGGGLFKVAGSTVTQIGKSGTTGAGANEYAVAVDASGNVYAGVWTNPQSQGTVYKETWGGGNSYAESEVSASFVTPTSIAVQPSGNLYVSDDNDTNAIVSGVNGFIYQETWNGSSWSQSTFSTAIPYPEQVVLDANGNLYIANYTDSSGVPSGTPLAGIFEESFTTPPSFAFGSVNVGSTSTAKTTTIENTGNLALIFYSLSSSVNPTLPAGYTFGSGNTCPEVAENGANGGLAIGATCTLSVSFAPTNNGADNGSVVLTDNNNNVADTTQSISVTGTGTGGTAPSITSGNSTTFTVGSAGSFSVTTTGTPKPALSESGSLPSGVTFTDNGNGTATIAGTASTTGTFPITITAASGVTPNATQSFTLTVSGVAPTITSGNSTTFTVGSAGSFSVTTTGTPKPALSESGSLPSGVTFVDNGNGTATLAGTPSANTGGTYSFTITANNGVSPNATQSFTLTIDQAPSITSASNTTFTVGTAGSFTATGAGYPAPTFSETGSLPSGVTLSSTGVLSGTPAAGTGGTYPITITASNGIGSNATQTFTLTVDQAPAINSGNNTTFTVGTAGSFTATGTGYPAPTFSETGSLPSGVTFSSAGVLSGTPSSGSGGTYTISITASNGIGSNATQTFTLTVDQAPAINSGNSITFTVGSAGSFTVTTTGYPTAALSEVGALPTGVTFVDNGNGTATLAGTPTALGSFPITITAANGTAPNATQSFTLTVSGIAPTITSAASATFTVNSAGLFTVTTTGNPTPSLSETGALPTGVTFVDNGNGTATLSGTPTQGGSFPITITANNGVSSSFKRNLFKSNDAPVGASQSFTLTVNPASQTISFPAPVIEPVYVGGSAALSATSTSGLPVGFLSATTSVCTVSGSVGSSWTVNFTAIGECSIEAYQWGNSNYAIAPQVFQGFYVHGLTQTISVTPITGTITAGSAVGISASATSSLPVSFTSKTPTICVVTNVVGWQLVASAKGTCTIVATQAGNATYTAAPAVTTSITIHGQTQTISFPAIVEPVTAGTSVTLGATASSGLPVTYASTHTAICTVSESGGVWSANLLTAGTCSIVAAQSGSTTFASAPNVNQNFYVHPTP